MDWTPSSSLAELAGKGCTTRGGKRSSEPIHPLARLQPAASAAHRQHSASTATFRVASTLRLPPKDEAHESCTQILPPRDHHVGPSDIPRVRHRENGRHRILSHVTSSTRVGKEISCLHDCMSVDRASELKFLPRINRLLTRCPAWLNPCSLSIATANCRRLREGGETRNQ